MLILAAVICLSLTGCKDDREFEKALELIEKGDYIEAKKVLEEIPDHEEAADHLARYETIEITEENWETYFEVVQFPVWNENAFGEGELFQIQYRLELREEYEPCLIAADAAFGFTSRENCYKIEIDGPNFEYNITDEFLFDMEDQDSTVAFRVDPYETDEELLQHREILIIDHCEVYEDAKNGYRYVYDADEVILTRVQGTIEVFR